MLNFKSLKWCFGIVLSLGLSACMDMQRSEQANYPQSYEHANTAQKQTVSKPKAQQKTYASKDPAQQTSPGPTRKAAPQIPVIQ